MSPIEIHQTLHGYSDGHRLLAASRRLPREAERALLIASDVSGPVTGGAFDSYLTGYPVPGVSAYALARTWLATELNRPGCVWTHTLLVEHADLARLPEAGRLRALFRRPQRGDRWHPYTEVARLSETPAGPPAGPPLPSERDAVRIVSAFYGVPDVPTVLVTDRPDRLEAAVLALWSQQWPQLRRTTRFCTWALAPRTIDGERLDLQIVPPTVYRQLRERQPTGVTVNLGARLADEPEPLAVPVWAAAAARDLLEEVPGELREFLWRFGPGMPALRRSVGLLVELAVTSAMVREGRLAVAALVEAVATRLPRPTDGERLKAAFFGGQAPPAPWPPEADVLAAIATTSRSAALDSESLDLSRRAAALWAADPDQALTLADRLAGEAALTPLGEQLLGAIASAIRPGEAAALKSGSVRLLAALTARNPALALAPVVLAPVPHEERPGSAEPGEARRGSPTADRDAPAAPGPPPAGEAPQASAEPPVEAVPSPGPTTVAEFLDALSDPAVLDDPRLPARWRGRLEARTPEVLSWLGHAEAASLVAVAAAASVVDPRAPEVRRAGASPWLRAIAPLADAPDEPLYAELMAFLLAVALDTPGPGKEELAVRAFDPVDRAAESGKLSAAAWDRLAVDLPPLPWWREWDRSERLRRGLVDRCLRHRWPPEALLRVTREEETFQRLVVICEWTRDGVALLKVLAARVGQDAIPATTAQRAILAPYA